MSRFPCRMRSNVRVSSSRVDEHIRINYRDARMGTESGAWRAAQWHIDKPFDCPSKTLHVGRSHPGARLSFQIFGNVVGIDFGAAGDDQARHRERKDSSLASSRLKYSSPERTSPRTTAARASST